MWQLTGFADEVSKDLGEQLALMNELNIKHVEFRSAWGTKVLDLDSDQLATAKSMLADAGVSLSSVGSDIGKIQITDDFGPHLDRMKHAAEVAHELNAPNIRMFSFFMPEGDDPDSHREEVMTRTRALVDVAEDADVRLLHENEKDIYGDVPRRVLDLVETMNSRHYRPIFDPANYVQCGVKPFDEAYPVVGALTSYVHIKDAKSDTDEVTAAGEGDGQVKEVLAALRKDGYDGFLSIEPHLGDFDAFGGLCGPDLWTTAYTALTGLLRELDIDWK